jgi:hypothetical protein
MTIHTIAIVDLLQLLLQSTTTTSVTTTATTTTTTATNAAHVSGPNSSLLYNTFTIADRRDF